MKRTGSENVGIEKKKSRMTDEYDGPSFEEELMMMGDDEIVYESIGEDGEGLQDADSTAEKRWKRKAVPMDPATQSLGTNIQCNEATIFIYNPASLLLQHFSGLIST